ncbi:helix-turn-helix transcriptional regulator [Nocardioides mangrovi]|uniref:LuxR C-terminal-related transcriptional regulator n=1 Tax=Nocardioides mangrovi TaxID=2874580 RepID=A0ABS7UAS6_9ACTN|nr:LuxR family transcriptional regulator [Nocardioides mangrovi]MBZ5738079.1 LuxR C-terminal-related transcriptional regulator [Nocardioides mangrovi]
MPSTPPTAGDLARAGEVTAALALLAAEADPSEPVLLLAVELDCRLARGELGEALGLGERLGPYLDQPDGAGAVAHHGRGELSAATGDPDLAGAHFARVARLVRPAEDDPGVLPWRVSAALAAVRAGRRAEGAALAREHLALARAVGSTYGTALGLRALATVDPRADHQALLREALALVATRPAARLAAQVRADLAGLLLLGAGPDGHLEALTLLRDAETYAAREQLWPLQGRVRRLLARLNQPSLAASRDRIALLTGTEQKVARLAAEGRSNREAAQELEVTVKAVEWHLSHVYRKLGIRSRVELPGALGLAVPLPLG